MKRVFNFFPNNVWIYTTLVSRKPLGGFGFEGQTFVLKLRHFYFR